MKLNYTKFTQDLQVVITTLKQNQWKIGFAESCTGGRLSAAWAEVPGVSDVFSGSVVSYSNEVKKELLEVQEKSLKEEGAVSQKVALEMAKGLRKKLKVDWALAITGIAGPTGGSAEKPVGTVWFAIAGPKFEGVQKKNFTGERVTIQQASVEFATQWLHEILTKN
jgi:nicotinamide-nucleotide amidase